MAHLRNIYTQLGGLAYKMTKPFIRLYANERHTRARTVILNDQQEILLVRTWFGSQRWTLPGGGIHRLESPAQAAAREAREETGLPITPDQLRQLGTFTNTDAAAPYVVACFVAHVPKRELRIARLRQLEMLDIAWFSLKNLPSERNQTVDEAIQLL